MQIKYRDAQEQDIPFITSTWLNACWNSKKYKDMKKTVFMGNHHKAIKDRMRDFSCVVACNASDPYVIFGYIIYNRPDVVHFAYVKGNFRRMGMFKALAKEAFDKDLDAMEVTHITEYTKELSGKYDLTYNPYKFFEVAQ